MEKEIINIQNVSKGYGDKKVLDNINLKVMKGEFISIIGSSGCGKTTLIKLINGLIKSDKGNIFINNVNINELDMIKKRRKIGYAMQSVGLFPHMKVRDNILFVLNLEKTRINKEKRIEELLKIVTLDREVLNRYPNELSGGQAQRVGICRALANKPEILLMDEPFSAVDEINRESLRNELIKIYKSLNLTIIFITHDIEEAFKLGTKIVIMENNKIVQEGTKKEILENPRTDFVETLTKNIK